MAELLRLEGYVLPALADTGGNGAAVASGVLIGGLAAAILMLALAVLPERATPRLARPLADRRVELAVAGVVTLVIVTVVYLVSGI